MCRRLAAIAIVLLLVAAARGEDGAPAARKPVAKKIERRMPARIEHLAVSPDGAWIAASDWGGAVSLFSTAGDGRRDLIQGTKDPLHNPADWTRVDEILFTGDGRFLVARDHVKDDYDAVRLHVFDVADATKAVLTIDAPPKAAKPDARPESVESVCREPKSSLVTLVRYHSAETWDVATGECRGMAPLASMTGLILRAPDARTTVESFDDQLTVLETDSRQILWSMKLDPVPYRGEKFNALAWIDVEGFTTGGADLITFSIWADRAENRTRRVCKIEAFCANDGKRRWARDAEASAPFAVGAETFAVVDEPKLVFFDASTGKQRGAALFDKNYTCATVSPDGMSYWAGTDDGRVVKVEVPAPAAAAPK